jgi:site-specific recombinase XerC
VLVPPVPTGDGNSAIRVRNLAIQALAYEKLKPSQIQGLNVADVNLEAGIVHVQSRKRLTPIYVSEVTMKYSQRWLAVHKLLGIADCALFVSLHWTTGRSVPRTRMSVRAIHNVLMNKSERKD